MDFESLALHASIPLSVFIVDDHQSFEQKLLIYQNFAFAVWNNDFCKTAGGNNGTRLTDFFLDFLDNAVDAGCIAVNNTAAHAVNGVGADDAFWRIKADFRKL